MTDQATAATETTSTETAATEGTAQRDTWPQRFGTLTELVVRQGKTGRFATITIDCGKFQQSAIVFNQMALEKLLAAGEGARVWVKGPVETVQKTGYKETTLKVIYAKDITPSDESGEDAGERAEADDAGESADHAEVVSDDAAPASAEAVMDDEIPF